MVRRPGVRLSRPVLFTAAEPRELAGILARCDQPEKLRVAVRYSRAGEFNGTPVVLVANGPGAKAAGAGTRAAIAAVAPRAIVSTGYCGGLLPALAPGDIFVATAVGHETLAGAPVRATREGAVATFRCGRIATLDHVVTTAEEKQRLLESGVAAVDMEAAAVAAAALEHGLPYFCIRAVLDTAFESFVLNFNDLRDNQGQFSRVRIIAAALRRPWSAVPELLELDGRARLCSRRLGEFLADCRF